MNAATPILQTRGLSKRFGGVAAVDGVDFNLREGELRCLIGPNGAGKSTFFRMLTGLKPSGGEILLRGRPIQGLDAHEIGLAGIAVKTQVPNVFDGLSVRANIMIAAFRDRPRREAAETVQAILDRLHLTPIADRPVGVLAHGQRQWAEMGIVLAQDADIVLLDEPTAGMTQEEVRRTAEIIRDINRDRSVIVVEHDMKFVRLIAGTVTVFHRGAILTEGPVEEILADRRVRDVYLGRKPA